METDDQAIQTILLGLTEDIYAAIDSCESAQEIWLRVRQMMKGSDIGIQEKKAKLFNKWEKEVDELRAERLAKTHDPLALMANSNNPFNYLVFHPNQLSPNPTTAMNMALVLMAKAFKLNYSTLTNNNQRISSNPRNRHIAQPGINIGQDRQMQMVEGNVHNSGVHNVGNQNGLIVVLGIANQNPNGMQASTSGTQTDKAPIYDSDGSAEVHHYDNCYNNDIFNMFTQEEQYTELLEPILEPHQVQPNDSNVISEVYSVEQSGEQ
ncbi:hypothetical protein Tco_1396767 [Tanacetum coccineum]